MKDGIREKEDFGEEELDLSPPFIPFRWSYAMLIYLMVFADAMTLTIPQPILPDMVVEQFGVQEGKVGFLVGILVGVPSMFHFFSSAIIGVLNKDYSLVFFFSHQFYLSSSGSSTSSSFDYLSSFLR